MKKIAVLCKASFTEGMGHVYRQLHLAKVLRDRGVEIRFFISDHPASVEILRKENFSTRIVEREAGPQGETGFDIAILDVQDTEKQLISSWRQRAKKIAGFEDLGEGRNFVDLLIDCNLDPKENSMKDRKLKPGVKPLFGLPYSVIAPEFGEYHRRKRIFSPALESLLVTMGGTDPNHLTLKLAEVFQQRKKEIAVTFVIGPGFKETRTLHDATNKSMQILSAVGNMAELLFNHQAVVCSGGVTLHESLAVGSPAFVISQVPHQREKTRPIARLGAAVDLGLPEDFDPMQISGILDAANNQLESMSRKSKELVDGQGIYRVADEILALTAD